MPKNDTLPFNPVALSLKSVVWSNNCAPFFVESVKFIFVILPSRSLTYTIAPRHGIPKAVSGVITIGVVGTELSMSLPVGVSMISLPIAIPFGEVSIIVIGPLF